MEALEHEEPGNLVGGPASAVAEPELASLGTGLGGDLVGVEPSLAVFPLAGGASSELSAVEAVELDPPELPEAFGSVPVWDERAEKVEALARIAADPPADDAADPVLHGEAGPVDVVLSVEVASAGRWAGRPVRERFDDRRPDIVEESWWRVVL